MGYIGKILILLFICDVSYGEVLIKGSIDKPLTKQIRQLQEAALSQRDVTIRINSEGGLVKHAREFVSYMEFVEGLGINTICIADGYVFSSAFYIFSRCNKRYMTIKTTFMIHDAFLPGDEYTKEELAAHEVSKKKFKSDVMENFKVSEAQWKFLSYRNEFIDNCDVYEYDRSYVHGLVETNGAIIASNENDCRLYLKGYMAGMDKVWGYFKGK